jgi:hypothetical protein
MARSKSLALRTALAEGFSRIARQVNGWSLFLRRAVEEFDPLPNEAILEVQP